MATAKRITQLVVITPNEVGTLTDLCRAVKDSGGSISHVCASALGEDARFMLNVQGGEDVILTLREKGYEISEADVIELEVDNRSGVLEPIAQVLGNADVDIEFLYGTTADGKKAALILSTNDNDRAMELLNA